MRQFIDNNKLILMEAGVADPLKRAYGVELHPLLNSAPATYSNKGRHALKEIRKEYIEIVASAKLPILILASTWRANRERVQTVQGMENVNENAVNLMIEVRKECLSSGIPIKVGGMMACKNDAYNPSQSLNTKEAEEFHSWQIQKLVETEADFIFPCTLPCLKEAIGISRALSKTNIDYMIGFVVNRKGTLLDGTPLDAAIKKLDAEVNTPPLGYIVNCSYPTFLNAEKQPQSVFRRLIGIQANASSLDHSQLDNNEDRQMESIEEWGNEMLKLHKNFGLKILGGCCGTRGEHLKYLIARL